MLLRRHSWKAKHSSLSRRFSNDPRFNKHIATSPEISHSLLMQTQPILPITTSTLQNLLRVQYGSKSGTPDQIKHLANHIESQIRSKGVIPGFIGLIDGTAKVGLSMEEIQKVIHSSALLSPDLVKMINNIGMMSYPMAMELSAVVDVSCSVWLAQRLGLGTLYHSECGMVVDQSRLTNQLSSLSRNPVSLLYAGVNLFAKDNEPTVGELLNRSLGVHLIDYGMIDLMKLNGGISGVVQIADIHMNELKMESGLVFNISEPDSGIPGNIHSYTVENLLKEIDLACDFVNELHVAKNSVSLSIPSNLHAQKPPKDQAIKSTNIGKSDLPHTRATDTLWASTDTPNSELITILKTTKPKHVITPMSSPSVTTLSNSQQDYGYKLSFTADDSFRRLPNRSHHILDISTPSLLTEIYSTLDRQDKFELDWWFPQIDKYGLDSSRFRTKLERMGFKFPELNRLINREGAIVKATSLLPWFEHILLRFETDDDRYLGVLHFWRSHEGFKIQANEKALWGVDNGDETGLVSVVIEYYRVEKSQIDQSQLDLELDRGQNYFFKKVIQQIDQAGDYDLLRSGKRGEILLKALSAEAAKTSH
ncbi:hypothetical protein WICPIJ_010154 [Wickerhamomyces pijperi]|uniref:Uncharacterized protein n=1 Tax=Wickerhamomyces pijperi TaxID=599730 RepID=A0A9P8TB81_WICPI|nr:hypothetical protein WICPIJ_010154 [Wickerhamomyces pijperi]